LYFCTIRRHLADIARSRRIRTRAARVYSDTDLFNLPPPFPVVTDPSFACDDSPGILTAQPRELLQHSTVFLHYSTITMQNLPHFAFSGDLFIGKCSLRAARGEIQSPVTRL
jgi:hypothetical protein